MRSHFTVSVFTLVSICLYSQSSIVAQVTTDIAAPTSIETAVDNMHLSGVQKDDAERLLKNYQQKQQEAQTQLLRGLENSLTAQQYQQLTASLHGAAAQLTTNDATAKDKLTSAADEKDVKQIPVTFTGGYDTDPRDHGRPVILVASALDVTPDVFRSAFSKVHPAGPNSGGPTDAEARSNKQVLMDALAPHGVTNDRLNEVSNYYRYNRSNGEMWKHQDATAVALVKDGKVVGVKVTNPGAGYSSEPTAQVPQMANVKFEVKLSYQTDLPKNGSVSDISVVTSTAAN